MNRTGFLPTPIRWSLIASIVTTVILVAEPKTIRAGVIVNSTDNPSALAKALTGPGLKITSATILNGAAAQFGTYSNFSTAPIKIGDGIILSTGIASQVASPVDPSLSGPQPSNDLQISGTPEFNAYGAGHIQNFQGAYDVAALQVNFHLAAASQIQFDFVFGSVEFPFWTSQFPDSLLTFLDPTKDQLTLGAATLGTANQIVYDQNGQPVQVGSSFAGLVSTQDKNTTFGGPHGVLGLTTTSTLLTAGDHTLLFEVGDVNDHVLDSAAFISNLRIGSSPSGTRPTDPNEIGYEIYHSHSVPEPSTLSLMGIGGIGLVVSAFRRWRASVV
jgi:hypothetical protein